MEESERYGIIFKKLAEALAERQPETPLAFVDLNPQEADEIAELRRLSAELQAPEPQSCTTT